MFLVYQKLVPEVGLEPTHIAAFDFESSASTIPPLRLCPPFYQIFTFFAILISMNKNRLETFSDSVMAIVVTLLAFDLKSPVVDSTNNFETLQHLFMLGPQFLIFILSFITISIMWINHHYITNKIEYVSHRTVWANSTLLMFISMIPFATSFLANNPKNQIALIVYSVVMLFASLAFTWLKYSSVKNNTFTHKREFFKHVGVYAYTLAIFVAYFTPGLTYLILLVPPLSYILPARD